ncbi:MAG TPA: type II toxin-antitoxin system prevent-host-death family antitoxin [Alphaproteobacteria bacterium]|jgi:prevent-host-death family protein|nr:type II toxin-antitoxin system prevent-host-death family antitoxin [Alphaproteobacteria bacterium]
MIKSISIREANQHLSQHLAAVERGDQIIITRRGRPIARLVPETAEKKLSASQLAALERSRVRMRAGYAINYNGIDRNELHDR